MSNNTERWVLKPHFEAIQTRTDSSVPGKVDPALTPRISRRHLLRGVAVVAGTVAAGRLPDLGTPRALAAQRAQDTDVFTSSDEDPTTGDSEVLNTVEASSTVLNPETQQYYTRFVDVLGIKIGANESVPLATLEHAAMIMRPMLGNSEVQRALVADGAFLGIIPRNGKLTDLPEFSHLKGRYYNPDEPDPAKRTLFDDFRLYTQGSTKMAVGEEHISPGDKRYYPGAVRHEFGHAVYAVNVYTNPERKGAWDTIYNNAKNRGIYKGTYGMTNAYEYWAEITRSLFGGVSKDEYGGPAGIQATDPAAYNFLVPTYGPPTPPR